MIAASSWDWLMRKISSQPGLKEELSRTVVVCC
jgi:hypothetical protein